MIREASVDDAKEIAFVISISNYYAYRDIIPREYFRYPVVTEKDIVEDMKRMKFYVYVVNDRIVGVAALHRVSDDVAWIRYVYVHPDYQRKGIGTALIRYIEDIARREKIKKLKLITHEKAFWAIRFYEKLGFKIVDRVKRAAWIDVVMEKNLE